MMLSLSFLKHDLKQLADPKKALILQGFFKTGKGEYAEGDIFLGISVPQSREIAVKYKYLPLSDVLALLQSKIHEERLIALLLLVHNFKKGNDAEQKEIYEFYLQNTKYVNNWDLVDLSADKIIGEYLLDKSIEVLFELARSKNLWERRIAVVATYAFIKTKKHEEALKISEILINDTNDLIQKAVGWMLREVGKRVSRDVEEKFLKLHYKTMPRTALRYAIEHFPKDKRKAYLDGYI